MNGGSEPAKLTWRTPLIRRKVLFTALFIAFFCYGFFNWVLWPVKVAGQSMMPNYHDGSRHFINKLAYLSDGPQRGDVVGLRAPDGDIYIKRIVGLPGETVVFLRGTIFIDGKPLKQSYFATAVPPQVKITNHLANDEYYVIGDNRRVSVFGSVPRDRIIGKVVF